jgi:spore cortex formation protein SpoVR/YcgB (stage V sporulation)
VLLEEEDVDRVLQHLANLWGYEVTLLEVEGEDNEELAEHDAEPRHMFT